MRTALLVTFFTACGCARSNPEVTPVAPDPIASTETPQPNPVHDAPIDFGPAGPVTITPAVPAPIGGMMDHAHAIGWSKDGTVFGFCQTSDGSGVTFCELRTRDGKVETIDDADASGSVDPKKTAANEARVRALGLNVAPAPWRYARDVEITWTVVEGDPMKSPARPAVLRLGARVRGEPTSWQVVLSNPKYLGGYFEAHPEAIAISPDGERLAVVAHTFAGEFTDEFLVEIVTTSALAAHAYNDAGLAHHESKDDAASANFFRKATAADPSFTLAH